MKRILSLLAVTTLVAAAFAPTSAQTAEVSDLEGCGVTTLDGRLVFTDADGNGRPDPGEPLRCGPGQELYVRNELAPAGPGRTTTRAPLGAWVGFADLQLADEESPLRGEWADKCGRGNDYSGSPVSGSAWRPHEAMNPHLINAHVKAANRIAEAGSPVLRAPVDFAVTMGDLADNQQYNETRLFIDLFDGGKIVDPGSGLPTLGPEAGTFLDGSRYDGVQAQDPKGSGVRLPDESEGGPPVHDSPNPQEATRLLDIAQRPFQAEGLRSGGGQMPWLAVPGNHDVKVQGTIPDTTKAWRDLVRRYAIGHTKLMELAPDYQARLCKSIVEQDEAAFAELFQDIIGNPYDAGTTKVVPADWRRLPLYRSDEAKETGDEETCKALAATDPLHTAELIELCESSWLEQLGSDTAPGFPPRHGLADGNRCKDESGLPLSRLCYSFERGSFLFVGLDTNPPEGLERGNIDLEQWEWLDRTLKANSTKYYDENGDLVQNPAGEDRMVVIMSHHTTTTMDNKGTVSNGAQYAGQKPPFEVPGEGGAKYGPDLIRLLQHYPNVILHASGHTHENKVWAHNDEGLGAGYWEVNTAAIADPPHQSRVFEIADNGDGTMSIFAITFEGKVPANPRTLAWGDDHTAEDGVNEDWLASFGREVGFFDPQKDPKVNTPAKDQNVELLLPLPFPLSSGEDTETQLTYTGDRSARVGSEARLSAVLTDRSGTPLENMTVTFERAGSTVSAVTDATGEAVASMRITGPKGTSPVTVSFAGAPSYLPTWIEIPFEATTGGRGG